MKNMMVGLIKRDSWLLLHQWRRLVVYFGSILLIDIMLVMYERSAVIEQEILGVSVQRFLSEPDKFPIQWVWNQVGILIIVIDFIRKDLSRNTSCFMPHIPKRKWYWYSKILCGGVLACGIVVFQILEKQFILSAYSSADYCININSTMLLESEILLLLGITQNIKIARMVYQLIPIRKAEVNTTKFGVSKTAHFQSKCGIC